MSTPRTKRQFAGASRDPAQRQITSFFATSDNTTSSSINQRPSEPSPSLPASIQSNLLSVGMRVRKSVPEGYKTGNYNAFSLWDERTNSTTATTMGSAGDNRSRANAVSTPRELLPFCGIHKVGGLDTQPEHPTSVYQQPLLSMNGAPLDDDFGNMPGLSSSQDSVDSMDSDLSIYSNAPSSTRKRVFTEDEDDTAAVTPDRHLNVNTANQNAAWRGADFDGEIIPRSSAPVGWGNKGRVMAVPKKGRLRSKLDGLGGTPSSDGQENVMVVDSNSGDFEEADFLTDSRTWEMDMSDI
ncbi:ribonucleotide reductase inhibitor-domain-containing protein [Biscogniauxia mediterranea]|nr:ribonucleotide reductase inhibitor-domain-containing protein [Biscogniauxia mediterranea]